MKRSKFHGPSTKIHKGFRIQKTKERHYIIYIENILWRRQKQKHSQKKTEKQRESKNLVIPEKTVEISCYKSITSIKPLIITTTIFFIHWLLIHPRVIL